MPSVSSESLVREGEGERVYAILFAVWTKEARVAAGWPYKEEYDSVRERVCLRFGGPSRAAFAGLGLDCDAAELLGVEGVG